MFSSYLLISGNGNTFGENLAQSGITTLLGLGTTFIVLGLLIGLITLIRIVLAKLQEKEGSFSLKKLFFKKKQAVVVESAPAPAISEPTEQPIDADTLSVIEKTVLGFAQNGDNTVRILSVTRASDEAVAPAAQEIAPEKQPTASAPVAGGGNVMKSPMPGTVLKIKVANGKNVKKDEVVFVLEAMKMENDIVAPCDGVFTAAVAEGAKVNTGDVIATIQ